MIEPHETVIFGVVAKLGTQITNLKSRKNFVRIFVSNLAMEELDAIINIINDETSTDDSSVCKHAKFARPELGRGDCWGMNHEFISIFVQSSCGLKSLKISNKNATYIHV